MKKKQLYRWQVKLIKNFTYKNATEMVPADKPRTLIDVKIVCEGSQNINDVMIRNHQTMFEIGDQVKAKCLGKLRWYHNKSAYAV